jgi:hypothetical protein
MIEHTYSCVLVVRMSMRGPNKSDANIVRLLVGPVCEQCLFTDDSSY